MEDDAKKPYKAYVASALSFVAGVVGIWVLDTDPFTLKEFAQACLTSGVSAGIIGAGTYGVRNPLKEF